MITEEEVRAFLDLQERINEEADGLARLYYASRGWKVECPDRRYSLDEIDEDSVSVVFRDYDGDAYTMSFPVQMLWDADLQQMIALEKEKQETSKVEKERQLAERKRQAIEAKEKTQLALLLEKYGTPEGPDPGCRG